MTKNNPRNKVTKRTRALEWWNELPKSGVLMKGDSDYCQVAFCEKYHKGVETITGREIEEIWTKENLNQNIQDSIDVDSYTNDGSHSKPQVDFDCLYATINHMVGNPNLLGEYTKHELNNMFLFFELISKSSTFAHKVHKELNRLNKSNNLTTSEILAWWNNLSQITQDVKAKNYFFDIVNQRYRTKESLTVSEIQQIWFKHKSQQ
jgi:hypothetical protein